MKNVIIFFSLLMLATSIEAQTITLGPIPNLNYCLRDTLFVPYQASGVFSSDNTFNVQLSDANGSFSAFTIVGHDTAMNGSIPVRMASLGSGFRVRVASSDPYLLSANNSGNIGVYGFPSPIINVSRNGGPVPPQNGYLVLGFADDLFKFTDAAHEPSGSNYLWQFDTTSSLIESNDSTPTISYGSEGFKRVVLTVTNPHGCAASTVMDFYVASCSPVIPKNALTVTTAASSGAGNQDPTVWVKAGGSFTQDFDKPEASVIFAEPGSSVGWSNVNQPVIYYLKTGTSFKPGSNYCPGVYIVLERGNIIPFADTLYCDHLNFDYSQVLSTMSTCTPTIAEHARIVDGTASGTDSVVWVKPGGIYTALGNSTVFVDPGASLISKGDGIYYIRRGGSLNGSGFVVVSDSDASVQCTDCIHFYCNALSFDSTRVTADVAPSIASSIVIRQTAESLFVDGEGNLETRILNLLGAEMLSKRGSGTLGLDLSSLPAGVYFAIVEAAGEREVKKILVVH